MAVRVNGEMQDSMKEALVRIGVARNTLLAYIKEGIIDEPPTVKQGRTKVRYFPEEWYRTNLPKIESL